MTNNNRKELSKLLEQQIKQLDAQIAKVAKVYNRFAPIFALDAQKRQQLATQAQNKIAQLQNKKEQISNTLCDNSNIFGMAVSAAAAVAGIATVTLILPQQTGYASVPLTALTCVGAAGLILFAGSQRGQELYQNLACKCAAKYYDAQTTPTANLVQDIQIVNNNGINFPCVTRQLNFLQEQKQQKTNTLKTIQNSQFLQK